MNNILNLTKIYTLEALASMVSKIKKKSKTKTTALYGVFGLIFLIFAASMGFTFYGFGATLQQASLQNYVLYYGIIYFNIMCLIFLSFQTEGLFFKTKDYSLLASLPIKSYQIVISKILSILLLCYFFELLIVVPAIVAYFLFVPFSILKLLFFVLAFAFLPCFTISVSAIVVFCINKISSKATKKDTVNMFLIFGFMFVLIAFLMYVNYGGLNSIIAVGGIPQVLHFMFLTSSYAFYAIDGVSVGMLALTFAINIALFAASVGILSWSYFSINKNYQNKSTSAKKQIASYEPKSVFKRLLNIEIKNFLNKPIYVFNTTFGMILLVIASVGVPILYFLNKQDVLGVVQAMQAGSIDFPILFFAFTPALFTFMSCTTNCSISLEGQAIYFKKSLPVEFEKIALAKIVVNLLVCLPILLFFATGLPVMIDLGMSPLKISFAFFVPVLTAVFTSLFGLMVNLWFPLLTWTNVTVVVKQSMATMTSILGGTAIGLGTIILFVSLPVASWLFCTIYITLLTALCVLFAMLIKTKGKKIFHAL
jgi:ABC-2 type transport system permease protein